LSENPISFCSIDRTIQTAWAEIMKNEVAPQVAAEKAFKRVEEIFAKYPIAED